MGKPGTVTRPGHARLGAAGEGMEPRVTEITGNGEGAPGTEPNAQPRLAEKVEETRQALLDRPRLSLRMQIYLALLAAVLLATAIATVLVISFNQVDEKTRFLEIVDDYALEVEQARRYEKNYFLYGTNRIEALDSVFQAESILKRNAGELAAVMGADWQQIMLPTLHSYRDLLEGLGEGRPATGKDTAALQAKVRKKGQEMVAEAQALLNKEKASLSRTLTRSREILIVSLIFLLLILVLNSVLLGTRTLHSIDRLAQHAHRIAGGDFSPITPIRRYRDEFTELAVAFNTMVAEIDNREAILIQSHKMRAVGTLTAGVAHELNNPLNNITLTSHLLKEDYDELDDEQRREMIDDVVGEVGRAKKIISSLLDFARESGSAMEPLDLPKLLKETIDLATNQIKLSGIRIEFQATGNLPRVHGDGQQLVQVFLNLLLNAIDASHKGGKIQVLVLPADQPNYLAVKVIDSGSGIPAHILSSIFDPFFTTKSKGKGTGLGLSVSQGIVAKHGGRILVSSQEGQGAAFTVVLPVTTIPAELGGDLETA